MSDWSHPAPSALDDKLSWIQPVTTKRVAESLECCSGAHSISGPVTVLAVVLQNVLSADRAFGENLSGAMFHQLPGTEWDMFLSGSLCQPNQLSKPIARASPLQTGSWCSRASCFQDWSFPVSAFHPKPAVQISGLAWAGKKKNVLQFLEWSGAKHNLFDKGDNANGV